ncbi:MAG: PHP domain-containing protein [Candidatus Omnitrophica bacterium]|nr:PHP domain-containing protein [Candidatus Omnitrophota bacterium]MCB9720816.1 PHP domain-containing protein [Candidatus Omnitrophota bacterium]
MTKTADLHIHTHFSDSTSSPEEVAQQAHAAGVACIGIADHDIVDGIAPTKKAAEQYDIEVIPGVELSTQANGRDVHMLGYLFDYENAEMQERLEGMQHSRGERMRLMIQKLSDLGISGIDYDEVCSLTESGAVGRPHLATVLVKNGVVPNMQAAFDRYLADDRPAFVPKTKLTPVEAIDLIRSYGGVAVLAHPMFTRVDELIPQFVEAGMQGLEVYYPNCTPATTEFYAKIAKKYDLVATGGSDAHGDAKKNTYLGKATIPYEQVEKLKERAHG